MQSDEKNWDFGELRYSVLPIIVDADQAEGIDYFSLTALLASRQIPDMNPS